MAFDALSAVSDNTLLALYAAGDAGAARSLILRLTPRLLGYATRILSDRAEAEDVTQEVMMRLWQVAPRWRTGEAQVATWAYRVATNLCTDRLRGRSRSRATALDDAPDVAATGPGVEASLIDADRLSALQAALASLPDRQRLVVVLRHIEGLANPEIAAVMDIGIEAVESLTARGKRALAAILAGRREELGYDGDG